MRSFRTTALASAAACVSLLVACSGGDAADELVAPVQSAGGSAGFAPDSSTDAEGGAKEDNPNQNDAGPSLAPRLAPDLAVREVSVFQAVKIPLARDAAAVELRNSPVIAGRKAVFRIHIDPAESFSPRPITAELLISADGSDPVSFASSMKVVGASSDEVVGSAFDIPVPADQLTTDTQWSVRLVDETAPLSEEGADHAARFPGNGSSVALKAQSDGPGLQLVLVPFRYDTDGSGRLPDTSDAQLEVVRELLGSVYPLVHAQLTVHEAVAWNEPLWFGDVNFNELNDRLYELKQQDGAPGQAYYYGLISPAESLDDYCKFTCVTGQSYVVDEAQDGDYRVGGGMGFTGEDSAWTLAHELGHLHGRTHAPCDVNKWDPDYPYDAGGIGLWGWDPRSGVFQDPKEVADLMGYCEPTWISDYTYAGLFERVVAVGSLRSRSTPAKAPHRFLHVDADGTARWGRTVSAASDPGGRATLRMLGAEGQILAERPVRAVRKGHGGYTALVPEAVGHVSRIEISGDVPRSARLAW